MATVEAVYLSLGSNLGNRGLNLKKARESIERTAGSVVAVSGIYESAPWGFSSRHSFYNCCMAIAVDPSRDPVELMGDLLKVEKKMGRERGNGGYSDRLIDIDLLLYGDRVLDLPGLKVPHPRMEERKFVLVPLAEIGGEVIHPLTGLAIRELLQLCGDPSEVRPLRPAPW